MAAHALLSASSAPVWAWCSGSVAVAQATPDVETEESRAGDAAHWVGSECLDGWRGAAQNSWTPTDYIGKIAPNGVVVDPQIAEGADVYVTDVIGTLARFGDRGRAALMVEKRVYMPTIHPDNWGTLDAAAQIGNRIYIWDYKNGHGKVDAFENFQLIDYIEGLKSEAGINGHGDQHTEVDARVVQPNCYDPAGPVSSWRFVLSELRSYVNQLREQAEEALTAPTLTTGTHCRHCPVRGRCSALRAAGYNLIDMVKAPMSIESMSGGDLATEREILQRGLVMMKSRIDAIEDDLTHRVKNGDASCGLTLEAVRGRLNWVVSPEQAIASAALFGVDIRKPQCMTPTQARAAVAPEMRDFFDDAIKPLALRKTAVKLINAADSIAGRVFSKK